MLHLLPRRLKSWLPCTIFLGYVFIISGLIVNFLMLLSCILWPFNKHLYRAVNYYLAYSLWSQFTFWAQWWAGCDVVLYMDPKDRVMVGKEHCLVLLNHKYDIDWLIGWILTERFGFLGASKVFVKKSLQYVPLIGWAWFFTETIFLRRQWNVDKVTILKDLADITNYPPGFAVNILLFAEGTRFTEKKLEASNKVALEKGLPTLKHTLLPRSRGFVQAVTGLRGRIDAIYDCTVAFPESRYTHERGDRPKLQPSLLNVLSGVPFTGHYYCKRIPMDEVPENEEECADWLYKIYKYKDDLFDSYLKTGMFPAEAKIPPLRKTDMIVWTCWALVLAIPLSYAFYRLLIDGSLAMLITLTLLTLTISYAVPAFVQVSETERGSSYGTKIENKCSIGGQEQRTK